MRLLTRRPPLVELSREILRARPAAYWPLNDPDTTARDRSGNGRDLAYTTAPAGDRLFGRAAIDRVFGVPSSFSWSAVGGFFYFPSVWTSASAYVGFVTQANGHQNLAGGSNVTGSFANEILLIMGNSGNAFRAWDSASGSIPVGWHFLLATYRAALSRWEVFVDSAPVSNAASNAPASSMSSGGNTVNIGAWSDGATGLMSAQSIRAAHVAYFDEISDERIAAILHAAERLGVAA